MLVEARGDEIEKPRISVVVLGALILVVCKRLS